MQFKKTSRKAQSSNRVLALLDGLNCELDEVMSEDEISIKRDELFYMVTLDKNDRRYMSLSLAVAMDDDVSDGLIYKTVNHLNSTYKVLKSFTLDRGEHVALVFSCELWVRDDTQFKELFETGIGSINQAIAEVHKDFPGVI